jgi:hypothetical protein
MDTESKRPDAEVPALNEALPALSERRWAYEGGYAVLVATAAALVLSPVLRRSGWPLNQGTTAPLLLVQMYATHIRHFDLFPVWSSTDGIGMGSPVLLYYHRAFFYLAGAIYALFGVSLKASVVITMAIFLAVGAYGMRRALSLVTASRFLCVVGSLGFLFTNYVFTDWLDPRGDVAEFSALMLVPWLLYWCLNLVKFRRFSYLIIPIMVVLVNAHSAIALTSVFLLTVAFIVFLTSAGIKGLRTIAPRLVLCIMGTTILLAPLLLAQLRFSQYYDPQSKNILGFNAEHQFIDIGRYLYDGTHQWFAPAQNQVPPLFNFVQIDFAIWVPIAAAVAFVLGRWLIKTVDRATSGRVRGRLRSPPDSVSVFLIASFACYLFLQLRVSYLVYRVLTPLQVINFPWRMLAYITPLGVVLVVVIADKSMKRIRMNSVWYALGGLWFASLVLLSPIPINDGSRVTPTHFTSMSAFMAPKSVDYQTFKGYGGAPPWFPPGPLYDVFLPKVLTTSGSEVGNTTLLYEQLHQHQADAQSLSGASCIIKGPPHTGFEMLSLAFSVKCDGRAVVALPISSNSYSKIFVVGASGKLDQIPYYHVPMDPRTIIHVPRSVSETVVVHLPTLWGVLF